MNIKLRMVATLVRLYPPAWRREYGAELTDLLLVRPLSATTIGDVAWSGVRERLRAAEPATLCGLALMLAIAIVFAWDIAMPGLFGHDWLVLLRESPKPNRLPRIDIGSPVIYELYGTLLVICGCWTHLRNASRGGPGELRYSAGAAMRIGMLSSIPIVLVGLLMLTGLLHAIVLNPAAPALAAADAAATTTGAADAVARHGFAVTYYSMRGQPPNALDVITAPLFRLPQAWIWGLLGGLLGRWIASFRRKTLASA